MHLKPLLNILIICLILFDHGTNHQQLDTQQLLVTFTKHDRNRNKVLEEPEIKSLIKEVLGEYKRHTQDNDVDIENGPLIEQVRQEAKMHDRKGDGLDFKEYVRFVKSMVDNEL